MIEQLELPDLEDPLAYLHGSYRSLGDLTNQKSMARSPSASF